MQANVNWCKRFDLDQFQQRFAHQLQDGQFGVVAPTGTDAHDPRVSALAVREVRRVLKPGGIAMISHIYRRPSWMRLLSKYGKENIEFKEEEVAP